jgi:hypothetical protein
MKFLPKFSAKSACLVLGLSALASVASASEIRMHVPVTARWGSQILPAGDYTVNLSAGSPSMRVSGNGKFVIVFVTSATKQAGQHPSYLKIVDVNGTPTVAAFASESQGVLYKLALPKGAPRS